MERVYLCQAETELRTLTLSLTEDRKVFENEQRVENIIFSMGGARMKPGRGLLPRKHLVEDFWLF